MAYQRHQLTFSDEAKFLLITRPFARRERSHAPDFITRVESGFTNLLQMKPKIAHLGAIVSPEEVASRSHFAARRVISSPNNTAGPMMTPNGLLLGGACAPQ